MSLKAICPLDGRYEAVVADSAQFFSEWALIRYRIHVEIEWLITMANSPSIGVRAFTDEEVRMLRGLVTDFGDVDAARVKEIERTTNHDVKAVEYYLKECLGGASLVDVGEWVHFGCTSEDINNIAYALMTRDGVARAWMPRAEALITTVAALATDHAAVSMLSHTHGQPASPTTLGKEMAVFVARWRRQLRQVSSIEYLGKFNGAVGNFNAHVAAYPEVDWQAISRDFVTSLGLTHNPLTTQIEPHDYLAELFHALIRFNNIALDFSRDIWSYISLGYFRQKPVAGEAGSSTMPHKVNPIDFENAESNLITSNANLECLANKLPISRLQRDLSDSSAQRNIGAAITYSTLALRSLSRGLAKLSVDHERLSRDLDANWEVLGEAVQTVMRKEGFDAPYERLKDLTRGSRVDADGMRAFIAALDLPPADRDRLLTLTPATYIGLATELARKVG